MGTEYAFIDDSTKEAYGLGTGPWYEWTETYRHTYDELTGPPKNHADVAALLTYFQEGWSLGLQSAWASVVADAIWKFVTLHPDARIVNDNDNYAWGEPNDELDQALREAGVCVYRQLGSRYEYEYLLTSARDAYRQSHQEWLDKTRVFPPYGGTRDK